MAISSLQQLVVGDGGDRVLLGLGDSGIVIYTPKHAGGCILFLESPLSPSEGVALAWMAKSGRIDGKISMRANS